MGSTCVDVTIHNPAEQARSWTGETLLDSGGFEIDPHIDEMKRLPGVLLKTYRL